MPIQTTVKVINKENTLKYRKAVLTWLKSDFDKQGKPKNHFWHNSSTVEDAFDRGDAMVALNDKKEFVGYMIWTLHNEGSRGEIDIVQVKADYRRQGIFKNMLSEFNKKFTDLCMLSASVIPESEAIFSNAGWKSVEIDTRRKYIKIIKPDLPALNALPMGHAIAICSENYYEVAANLDEYKQTMKYFQIDLNENNELRVPIITDFHYEGYIGVYFNQKLIAQGKAKNLFEGMYGADLSFLIIRKIKPLEPKPFYEKGFFSQLQKEGKKQEKLSETAHSDEQPKKKQRVEAKSTVPEKSEVEDEEINFQSSPRH